MEVDSWENQVLKCWDFPANHVWLPKGTLWLFNIAMENGPFIDGLPVYLLKNVIFHGYVTNNQMVYY